MGEFVSGALAMGYAVAALFFAKFLRETRDRLFAFFTVAFCLLALQRLLLHVAVSAPELEGPSYALRALAFLVLIAAILDKNRRPGS
jgi:hypothetical protein